MKGFTERNVSLGDEDTEELLGLRGGFVSAVGVGTFFGDDCYTNRLVPANSQKV